MLQIHSATSARVPASAIYAIYNNTKANSPARKFCVDTFKPAEINGKSWSKWIRASRERGEYPKQFLEDLAVSIANEVEHDALELSLRLIESGGRTIETKRNPDPCDYHRHGVKCECKHKRRKGPEE
jgi:hypothetical protein